MAEDMLALGTVKCVIVISQTSFGWLPHAYCLHKRMYVLYQLYRLFASKNISCYMSGHSGYSEQERREVDINQGQPKFLHK